MTIENKKTFPRQVVISPGFGAGLVSWWSVGSNGEDPYNLGESSDLIECLGENNALDHFDYTNKKNEKETKAFLIEKGWDKEYIEELYWGGWHSAKVITVYGPYKIVEYDGSESVTYQYQDDWRN